MNFTVDRFNKAIEAATEQHEAGADIQSITDAAHKVLADLGCFGKDLDRTTRRVVNKVTGISLEPGEGHGTKRSDGTVSYRG